MYFSLNSWLGYSQRRRLLDADLGILCPHMKGRVLEIGNGRIGRRGRFRPPVTDVSEWIYADLDGTRKPHLQTDITQLPLKDSTCDTVVCLEVLEYVVRYENALREIFRILKPGGKFILSTPFLHRADSPQDYWRFTEHSLRYLLETQRFSILSMKAQGAALSVVVNVLKYIAYVQSSVVLRQLLALMFFPVLKILACLDAPLARSFPRLATFATGYLIVAEKRSKDI